MKRQLPTIVMVVPLMLGAFCVTQAKKDEKKSLSATTTADQTHLKKDEPAFRGANVTLNGLRFHYLEWPKPDAPAILTVPGVGGGGGGARQWAAFAAGMRDRYRILAMEQRGHAESEWAAEYRWQVMVQDIDAFVDAFHLAPVTVIGHSSGATLALLYAARHPEKVGRVVAVDGGSVETRQRPMPPNPSFASPEEGIEYAKSRWGTDPSVELVVRDWITHGIRQLEDGRWGWRVDPALWEALNTVFVVGDELAAELPKITCPSLLVGGAKSRWSGEIAERVAAKIQKSRLVKVPNAGHVVHLANPSGFLAVVREFLLRP